MSISRYTSAESTEMISQGICLAISSAAAVLPEAVGPMMATASDAAVTSDVAAMLLTAREEFVQIGQGQLAPGRAAVVALVCAFGGFHLAQQRVHFRDGEAAIGAHCRMAGQCAEQFVTARPASVVGDIAAISKPSALNVS